MQDASKHRNHEISPIEEAVGLLPKYLEKIKQSVSLAVKAVESGENEILERDLGALADKIGRLVSIFGYIHRDCKRICLNTEKTDLEIKQIKIHLLSILKAIQTAQATGDSAMLVDLLEFELQDNLTQWKIRVFPQIREMAQTNRM